MGYLVQTLWLVPLSIHLGYFWATLQHFPDVLTMAAEGGQASRLNFAFGWCGVVFMANMIFWGLLIWLPKMRDSMLQVPAREYWLSLPERRSDLISRLRSMCSASLFGLNVFFLAVYQMIYQSHVSRPYLAISSVHLVVFFMVFPLLVALFSMAFTLRGLAVDGNKRGS